MVAYSALLQCLKFNVAIFYEKNTSLEYISLTLFIGSPRLLLQISYVVSNVVSTPCVSWKSSLHLGSTIPSEECCDTLMQEKFIVNVNKFVKKDLKGWIQIHCMKSVQIQSFFGPYFPVYGLNTEIKCRKVGSRKTPYLDNFHGVISAAGTDQFL